MSLAPSRKPPFIRSLLLSALLWSVAGVALAEATVIVELRTPDGAPTDGTVELTKGEAKYGCTTQKGRCEIKGVPGGMYNVAVSQGDKPASKAKSAMIPPSGEVKLIVNAN